MTGDGEDNAIVDAVLRLAAGLRLVGRRRGRRDAASRSRRCSRSAARLSQGYHYARPQSPEDLDRMLAIEALGELTV